MKPKITHIFGSANELKESVESRNTASARTAPVPQYFSLSRDNHKLIAMPTIEMKKAMNAAVPRMPVSARRRRKKFLAVIRRLKPSSGVIRRMTSGVFASGWYGSASAK